MAATQPPHREAFICCENESLLQIHVAIPVDSDSNLHTRDSNQVELKLYSENNPQNPDYYVSGSTDFHMKIIFAPYEEVILKVWATNLEDTQQSNYQHVSFTYKTGSQ
jgi:hypothetical protein